jgi:hypothetical protein
MSPSTAPPFCSLTRTARIVPLTRPQTVTFCAMMLPSICAPSLIRKQLAFDSAEDLSLTFTFDVTNDPHARADARARPRFWHRRARRDLFSNRVLLLHHSLRDFGRICCRVLSLLGCLAFEEHVHLRFRRHAVQKGPKGCRTATSRKRRAFKLGCRLRVGLRKLELPLRWSLRVRAIPCTVPCQGFHFLTMRASQPHFDLKSAISLSRDCL